MLPLPTHHHLLNLLDGDDQAIHKLDKVYPALIFEQEWQFGDGQSDHSSHPTYFAIFERAFQHPPALALISRNFPFQMKILFLIALNLFQQSLIFLEGLPSLLVELEFPLSFHALLNY